MILPTVVTNTINNANKAKVTKNTKIPSFYPPSSYLNPFKKTNTILFHHQHSFNTNTINIIPISKTASILSLYKIQSIGEAVFIGALVISLLQAIIFMYQYRTNPKGELIVPPGRTWGIEHPDTTFDQSTTISPLNRQGNDTTINNQSLNNHTSHKSNTNQSFKKQDKSILDIIKHWIIVLLPWISRQWNILIQRNSHLFHITFIMAFLTFFDFYNTIITQNDTTKHHNSISSNTTTLESSLNQDYYKIIVIGDSLACGIGCTNTFDSTKNSNIPMSRIESLSRHSNKQLQGPIFPLAVAREISNTIHKRTYWRSGGVDGGTVNDINQYCIGIIQEESKQHHPPDVVIILCGVNDLKQLLSNPMQLRNKGRAFKESLYLLIENIHFYAPNARILFPSLPIITYKLSSKFKGSSSSSAITNILPLVFFLNVISTFWDLQKKLVADEYNSKNGGNGDNNKGDVQYIGLLPKDIMDWYNSTITYGMEEEEMTLIADDGIHPNKRCYMLWGKCVGEKIADIIMHHH